MTTPGVTKGVRAYLVFVFLFVVGFLLFLGFAIGMPLWLTIPVAAAAGIGYAVGITYWMSTHRENAADRRNSPLSITEIPQVATGAASLAVSVVRGW